MADVVYKCVMDPGIARPLLHLGYPIVDIKPKKEDPNATVFLFEVTDAFMKDFKKLKGEAKEKNNNS